MAVEICLDLRTIPAQDPAVKAEIFARAEFAILTDIGEIKPDARLTDSAKIEADIAHGRAKATHHLAAENAKWAGAAEKEYLGNLARRPGWAHRHLRLRDRPPRARRADGRAVALAEFIDDVDSAIDGEHG
jgi:hypothetical protein